MAKNSFNPDNKVLKDKVVHKSGNAGGMLVGNRHSESGIKAINKSTGQPLEMEGGEVVITRNAVSDPTKRSFNGKMLTNREILSSINESGGGVSFSDGGELPEMVNFDINDSFEYGGKTIDGKSLAQILSKSGLSKTKKHKIMKQGGSTDSDSPRVYIINLEAFNNGQIVGKWLDFYDYKDEHDFEMAIQELLDKWGVEEYFVYDSENLPTSLYWQHMGSEDWALIYNIKAAADDYNLPFDVAANVINDSFEYGGKTIDGKSLAQILSKSGLSKNMTLKDIAKKHKVSVSSLDKELKKGIKVEKEHTTDQKIAKKIAMDHLVENPKYYTRLAEVDLESGGYNEDISPLMDSLNMINTPILSKGDMLKRTKSKRGQVPALAKKIRKKGEQWSSALKRAKEQLDSKAHKTKKEFKSEIEKLHELIENDPILKTKYNLKKTDKKLNHKTMSKATNKPVKYIVNVYNGGEMPDEIFVATSIEEAHKLANQREHSEITVMKTMATGGELMAQTGDLQQLGTANADYLIMEKGGSTDSDSPRVYIANLEAYNNGKLIGEWLDFSDYNDEHDFEMAIQELLDKWGVEEYAVHDYEYLPASIYSEYMGSGDWALIYKIKEAADEYNLPFEVAANVINDMGEDAIEGYQGTYNSWEDFAENLADEIGIESFTDFERYLTMTDLDRRLFAQEMADSYVDDIRDEDDGERLIQEAELDLDEYQEADEDRREEMLDEAREIVYDEYYDTWYEGLDDPYDFLVEEHGLYDIESFRDASFVRVDYEALGDALSYDYTAFDHDGEMYFFNNYYEKGGQIQGKLDFEEGGFMDNVYKSGGRLKSAINRDRKYFNKSESWERAYSKGKNRKGYMASGGEIDPKSHYKTIMSDGNRKLYFTIVNENSGLVTDLTLKQWLESELKDKAEDHTKNSIIKAILQKEKQFNKKVDYNMWVKKTDPTFEEIMEYFIKNKFISNIGKNGIAVYESYNHGGQLIQDSVQHFDNFYLEKGGETEGDTLQKRAAALQKDLKNLGRLENEFFKTRNKIQNLISHIYETMSFQQGELLNMKDSGNTHPKTFAYEKQLDEIDFELEHLSKKIRLYN